MRNAFIKKLMQLAEQDDRIFVISADLGYSVLDSFIEKYPQRYLNVGISEQNAMGIAAGMALSGKIPYVYSIIPFVTLRCLEQIKVDVAYMNTNVRIIGVGAGLAYGPAGATHHAIEDISVMRGLPNMKICSPSDPYEVEKIVEITKDLEGPVYIRLAKGGEPITETANNEIVFGKARVICEGKDLYLLSTSSMMQHVVEIKRKLDKKNINTGIVSFHTIKPFDEQFVKNLIDSKIPFATVEEHTIVGGLGTAVSEIIAEYGKETVFKRFGINDFYTHDIGNQDWLYNKLFPYLIDDFLLLANKKNKMY